MNKKALGVFETIGFVPALTGADAALKSAEVELLGCRYVGSGLVSVLLSGDVSSVKVAVESGCSAAGEVGTVQSQTVIARTAEGLEFVVEDDKQKDKKDAPTREVSTPSKSKQKTGLNRSEKNNLSEITPQKLAGMKVIKLRELARQFPGILLKRSEIRSARKDELIDAIINDYRKNKE